jgi:hypothetical protein
MKMKGGDGWEGLESREDVLKIRELIGVQRELGEVEVMSKRRQRGE